MAKALIGYMSSDLRTPARLVTENRRLRERVVELEALVLRLKDENDTLSATRSDFLDLDVEPISQMQPA